jgi:zinc protease
MKGAARMTRSAALAASFGLLLAVSAGAAGATSIERVTTPSGIEAWLVREPSSPVLAVDFAFRGGAAQDPADRPGVANLAAELVDEGAGALDGKAYHEALERRAIELSFAASRDFFRGSLRTLAEDRDAAIELLRLALNEPRFDDEALQRVKAQVLSGIRRDSSNPREIAGLSWWAAAFPDHPYGLPVRGSLESVPRITAGDLRDYTHRIFARDNLKIAFVGDVDPPTVVRLVEQIFGKLPARAQLATFEGATPQSVGKIVRVDLDVPQTVIQFGGAGLLRKDPDFIAGVLVNHVLSGGSLTSRLYSEIREKRGLVYSIFTAMQPFAYAGLFSGETATRADRAAETVALVEREIARLAEEGPTEEELAKAKSYLKGAFALNLDTSSKIAAQLVQLQTDDLGPDYIDKRKQLIDAVTLSDAKRVAKRILAAPLLVAIVGRPPEMAGKGPEIVRGHGGASPAVAPPDPAGPALR